MSLRNTQECSPEDTPWLDTLALCGDYRVGHRLCFSHPGDDEDIAEGDGDGQETQQTIQTTVGIVCLEFRLELEHTLATCWTRRIDGARVATLAAIDV